MHSCIPATADGALPAQRSPGAARPGALVFVFPKTKEKKSGADPKREAAAAKPRQSASDGGILRDHARHHEDVSRYGHQRQAADATFLLGGARAAVSRLQPACTGAQRQRLSDIGTGVRRVPVSVTRALSAMGGTFRGDGRA